MARLLDLQRAAGNAAVARQVATQGQGPAAAPAPVRSKQAAADIDPLPPLAFQTPAIKAGDLEVFVSGRVSTKNTPATLIGEQLPKDVRQLPARLRAILGAELPTSPVTGSNDRIEATIGGQPLVLELPAAAAGTAPFDVAARFSPDSLATGHAELSGAGIHVDLTVHIKPPPAAAGATPAEPSAATVTSFTLAGEPAVLTDAGRTGAVVAQSLLDELETRLPAFVKNDPILKTPEQRIAWLQEERAWFGTDAKTLDHFADLKDAQASYGIKGPAILHERAATRLKAVQDEIGIANMPTSHGVGWPRSEGSFGGEQKVNNLHNLGLAIDYNALEAPNMKDRRELDLLSIITGRPAYLELHQKDDDFHAPGRRTNAIGDEMMGGDTDAQKQAFLQRPEIKAHLDRVLSEAKALTEASERFRHSLGGEAERNAFLALRDEWFKIPAASGGNAALQADMRKKTMAMLPSTLKPWLDQIDAHLDAERKKIQADGYGLDEIPHGAKALGAAGGPITSARNALAGAATGLAAHPGKHSRDTFLAAIDAARKLLGKHAGVPGDVATDADLKAEGKRLTQLLDKWSHALGVEEWIERVQDDRAALLTDPTLVFGKQRSAFEQPGMAQLVDTGYFQTRQNSSSDAAFSPEFVQSMVKHGFTPLASSSTPDSMHFELRPNNM